MEKLKSKCDKCEEYKKEIKKLKYSILQIQIKFAEVMGATLGLLALNKLNNKENNCKQ